MLVHAAASPLPHPAAAPAVLDGARLAVLARSGLLGGEAEEVFDRLTRLATRVLGTPVALFTLVGDDRQVFKSQVGLREPWAGRRGTPLTHSFCQHVVARRAPLVVPDARLDPVLADNAAIEDLGVVAYCGVPVVTHDGHALGSFCAIDTVPRRWTADDVATLEALCRAAVVELELRAAVRRAEEGAAQAREAAEVARAALHAAPDALLTVDAAGRLALVNARAARLLGREPAALRGLALWEAFPAGRGTAFEHELHAALASHEPRHLEMRFVGAPALVDGAGGRAAEQAGAAGPDVGAPAADRGATPPPADAPEWLEVRIDPAAGPPGGAAVYLRDITARRRMEDDLQRLALHDPLTGLANRALFQDRLEHALTRHARAASAARGASVARSGGGRPGGGAGAAEHLAVLLLDVDGFRTVNDSLGHAAGDRLLSEVAARLLATVRDADTVARLGGDEFAVLLEGLDAPEVAERAAERVLRAFDAPFLAHGGEGMTVRASIGVAHAGEAAPGEGAAELLRNADVAMYHAKAAGRGRHAVYEAAMRATAMERLTLEAALRAAVLAPTAQGLSLAYQPVVDLETGALTAVEALLRWHPPGATATVPPPRFVALAEETGLIVPLGRWVLETACRQLAEWERTLGPGAVPRLNVNLSARQLDDPEVVRVVAHAMRGAGVAADRVTLEVTETALARDGEAACDVLVALQALGVRLAVDDFGTGYSNLGYLQRLPMAVLKVDKRFVDGVALGGRGTALARTIVALGHSLGLHTVAEGIERAEQRDALRALGCGAGQGFLFARPLPPEQLVAWVRARDS